MDVASRFDLDTAHLSLKKYREPFISVCFGITTGARAAFVGDASAGYYINVSCMAGQYPWS